MGEIAMFLVIILVGMGVLQAMALRRLKRQRDQARKKLASKMRLLGECRRASALDPELKRAQTIRKLKALVDVPPPEIRGDGDG